MHRDFRMSRKYSNFEVQTKKILSPMPYKDTNIFSEIGKFFKEKDATSAMNTIMDMTGALRLSEKRLLGNESRCNCKCDTFRRLILSVLFFVPANQYWRTDQSGLEYRTNGTGVPTERYWACDYMYLPGHAFVL